jgi:hypothetical protein
MKKNLLFNLLSLAAFILLASCSTKVIDIKSPCVSSDDGPCGPKKSINQWWMNNNASKQQQKS